MIAMMILTLTAMVIKLKDNIHTHNTPLIVVGGIILILVLWLVVESIIAFRRHLSMSE